MNTAVFGGTADPDGGSLPAEWRVTTTEYDQAGDAATTVTTYWNTAGDPDCAGRPAWGGRVCRSGPRSQPGTAGLPGLPVSQVEGYDRFGRAVSTVERVTDAAGAVVTRTTRVEFDPVTARPVRTVVSGSGPGVGAAVAAVSVDYDAAGRVFCQRFDGADCAGATEKVVTGWDDLGRVVSYTDAAGAVTTTGYDPVTGRVVSVADPTGTRQVGYDDAAEPRGLPTSVTDSAVTAGGFTAAYGPDGQVLGRSFPGGLVATRRVDQAGASTGLSYAKGATVWVTFTAGRDPAGRVATAAGRDSRQVFGYDAAGRLVAVADTVTAAGAARCTVRRYAFDADSNRTALTSVPPRTDGGCDLAGAGVVTGYGYDRADRLTPASLPGLGYDPFGRISALPAAAADGTGPLSVGYYLDDLVARVEQAGRVVSFGRDPAGRVATRTDTATPGVTVEHYPGPTDRPGWTDRPGAGWTRYVPGVDGALAATVDHTGAVRLAVVNLHGDVVATPTPAETTLSGYTEYTEYTEYGAPRAPGGGRYGWLGAAQRPADVPGGLLRAGVRLYAPGLGRFLQPDPVPGGSANDYDYGTADPINQVDLDGTAAYPGGGTGDPTAATPTSPPKASRGAGGWAKTAARWAWQHRSQIAGGLALTGCIVLSAGGCLALSVAALTVKWTQQRSSKKEMLVDVLTLGMTAKTGFLLERAGVTAWGGRVAQHAKLRWYDGSSYFRWGWVSPPPMSSMRSR